MLNQKQETETDAALKATTLPWWREAAAQEAAQTLTAPSLSDVTQSATTISPETALLQKPLEIGESLEAEARRRARLAARTQIIHADKTRQFRRLRKETAWGAFPLLLYTALVTFNALSLWSEWPNFRPSPGLWMTWFGGLALLIVQQIVIHQIKARKIRRKTTPVVTLSPEGIGVHSSATEADCLRWADIEEIKADKHGLFIRVTKDQPRFNLVAPWWINRFFPAAQRTAVIPASELPMSPDALHSRIAIYESGLQEETATPPA